MIGLDDEQNEKMLIENCLATISGAKSPIMGLTTLFWTEIQLVEDLKSCLTG